MSSDTLYSTQLCIFHGLPHPLILYLHRTDAVGFLFFFSYCISICMKFVILKYLNWHHIWVSIYGLHFES